MHTNRRRLLLVALLSVVTLRAASAHDTWLLPSRFDVAPGAKIAFELTSGMKFPEPESAVAADRIAASGVRLSGRTLPLLPEGATRAALRLSANAPTAGVATVWATSRPRTLSLKPEEVEHYLEEIGAPPAVEARYREQGRFRESYSKLAKTYVRAGEPADDRSWQEPVGLPLEFVPLRDPTDLVAGSELAVSVLRDGRLVADFAVSALPPGSGRWINTRTDREGRAVFKLDRPGAWLLRGTLIEQSSQPDTDWQSLFTTLSISVKPGR